MQYTTSTNGGVWETIPCTCQLYPDREIWTIVYEGYWDSLLNEFNGTFVGDSFDATETIGSASWYQSNLILSSFSITRKPGGLGECRIQYTALLKREIWNIDFAEVSKNIRNWLVESYTGASGVDPAVYQELMKIKSWEKLKDNGNFSDWGNFLWQDDSEPNYPVLKELDGDTLTLAQKIMKGVENYPIYTPVITRTTVWAFQPEVGVIGCKDTPASRTGWFGFGGAVSVDTWKNYANVFLKTAERSTSNGDGTFTLVEQWTGADELDPDLYPSA